MKKIIIKSKINDFINDKLIEWSGKTISSNEHFQAELKNTLIQTVLYTIETIKK